MRENAGAADLKLSADELERITDLWRNKFAA
jgi:diketogulonate reductase-like aldo/keto reductase